MPTSSIFSAPTATSHSQPVPQRAHLKRKKGGQDVHSEKPPSLETSDITGANRAQPVEYAAVVTPNERSQRRLAGWPLDQEPPSLPFPHARPLYKSDKEVSGIQGEPANYNTQSRQSLHSRHLSAMTAVLHRCMLSQDYTRAGRALGLLLRNEVGGLAIDIRSEGLYGIGAEILLRQNDLQSIQEGDSSLGQGRVTTAGFERARLYYERLMVQYPAHKTWPDATNTHDFCIALFGLWVFVVNQESVRLQKIGVEEVSISEDIDQTLLEAKQWEVDQAKRIAEAMDTRMRDVAFNGDPELVRLRAMVALWTADLIESCVKLEESSKDVGQSDAEQSEEDLSNQIERAIVITHRRSEPPPSADEASTNRSLARSLLGKLENARTGSHGFGDS